MGVPCICVLAVRAAGLLRLATAPTAAAPAAAGGPFGCGPAASYRGVGLRLLLLLMGPCSGTKQPASAHQPTPGEACSQTSACCLQMLAAAAIRGQAVQSASFSVADLRSWPLPAEGAASVPEPEGQAPAAAAPARQ